MITRSSFRFHWSDLAGQAALALSYAVITKIVLDFYSANGVVSIVWPPSGLALAALILGGRKYWPGVFVGAFAGNPLAVSFFIAVGNTLEALAALWLLTRKGDFDAGLTHTRCFLKLLLAGVASSCVSAVVGTTTLWLAGLLTSQTILINLLHWWQGDVLGIMLVTPLILVWRQAPQRDWFSRERVLEVSLFLLLDFFFGQIIFLGWFPGALGLIAQTHWMFLFVTWAAVRFGRHGVLLVLCMTAVQALSGVALGAGYFAGDMVQANLENFWFFMVLLTLVGFSLASLMKERAFAEDESRRERQFSDDIINSLPGLFYMLDDQGKSVRWNLRAPLVTGYSDEEMAGMQALEFIDAKSVVDVAGKIQQAFLEGDATSEAGLLSKQGTVTPYHFTGRRIILQGKAYVISLGDDITERKLAEKALLDSELKYRQLFEKTDARIVIYDTDGIVLMMNESNARMLGGLPADFIGRSLYDMVPEGTAEMYRQRYAKIIREGRGGLFEDPFPMPEKTYWFASQLAPLTDASGKIYAIQLVAIDITERKQMEETLRQSEELWKFALEGAGDAVWDWNPQTNDVKHSPRWKALLGFADDEVANSPEEWMSHLHPDDLALTQTKWLALKEGLATNLSFELRLRSKDGSWKWFLSRGMVVSRDASGNATRIVGTNADISLLKEHQQQLEHIAHYDALTNTPNRVLLADRLRQAMVYCQRRKQSLAVAYLDLDGFKVVNDRYGHDVGDKLLIVLAQRMKAALREGDTLARIGGDEFVAVLVDLEQPQDCDPVLVRLLQAAATPVKMGEAELQVGASIGVTIYPRDGADADQLMRHADQAMYQAKQAGKNRYHLFDVDQDAAVQTQHESLQHMRQALDRREFLLYYQPKVNMKSGAVIGAEALIRWQHPERGLLPPATFLPIIEDQPISVALGEWVIDTALAQMAEWHAAGLDIPVSVNIAAHHLQHDDFVARLTALLAAHADVAPTQLELEILETSALEDMAQVSEVMHACRALGVGFALDDFGTGYSSLTYLKRLPAELLKIDQSFVRDMLDDPNDLAIVNGVIGLATAFQRKVIAEGVETVAHGELLLSLGCELAQGYGIARPMPAAEMPGWVATWRPDVAWKSWQARNQNRDDLGLVFVEVKHRHWLRAVECLLASDQGAPLLDIHDCHFGHWQESDGRGRYGAHPEFPALTAVHAHLHALAGELIEAHAQGQQADVQTRLAELHALSDELIEKLRGLARGADKG